MSLTASLNRDKLQKVTELNKTLQFRNVMKNLQLIEVLEVYLLNEIHNGNQNIDIRLAVDKIKQIKICKENINSKSYYEIMNFFIEKIMLQILINFNPSMFKRSNIESIKEFKNENDQFENGFMNYQEIKNMKK